MLITIKYTYKMMRKRQINFSFFPPKIHVKRIKYPKIRISFKLHTEKKNSYNFQLLFHVNNIKDQNIPNPNTKQKRKQKPKSKAVWLTVVNLYL